MRGYMLSSSIAVLLAVPAIAGSAAAAPWVHSYVVTDYEPAWYYGGREGVGKVGDLIQPGSDCPKGSFTDIDYNTRLLTPWRNAKQVATLLNPPHTDAGTVSVLQERLLSYRGFRDGINVYINPFAAPDPGLRQVTGKIAEGFDLDGSAKTGGFTSPDGQKGIDNAFYRAWGCVNFFRDKPYHAILGRRVYDQMMVSGFASIVIRVSGNKDPMNDDDATVEVGFSPDAPVVGGKGSILPDYSYRLVPNKEYTKVKATVKNGVVETTPVDDFHMARLTWFVQQYGDLDLHKGRMQLKIDADGNVSGLIGGYQDWRDLYSALLIDQAGGHEEQRDGGDAIGEYYALKRNADGLPDPKTGRNTGISIAYRIKAQPAFVIDATPGTRTDIRMNKSLAGEMKAMNATSIALYKALSTHQIQPVPVDSTEGSYARGKHLAQQPDGSWQVVPTKGEADLYAPTVPIEPKTVAPPKPELQQQQVRNTKPTAVATQ